MYGLRQGSSLEVATFLGQSGVPVISGMAKGIDSYAHTACLKAGGYTLAFVANGVDICYPPEHQTLMEEIIENGAVISLYPPCTRPRQEYFPYRNKLLAAWVDKLLVVEAAERSGALITAEYARHYKRKVFAVPNNIYSPESKGTNRLLLSGAEVYLEPRQLLGEGRSVSLLDVCHGDLSALLEVLCQMEIEGKVIVSGQIVLLSKSR